MFSRRLSHINLKYVLNRLSVMIDEKMNPDHPWLTSDAVKVLSSLIKTTDVGIEFGSGRSTIWFAKRLKSLISIEDNHNWYNKVSNNLIKHKLDSRVDYRYINNLELYYQQAKDLTNNSMDFCLIDGVVRDKCALSMIEKTKKGGLIVIDNINWYIHNEISYSPDSIAPGKFASDLWKEFDFCTKSWRRIWTSNGVTETCIFIKP